MKRVVIIFALITALFVPSVVPAIEGAQRITDREIVVRLTRLEEGQKALENQMKQFREDMNSQFNRIAAIFTALVVAVIGFAIWDRRTMIRPFEVKVNPVKKERAFAHFVL